MTKRAVLDVHEICAMLNERARVLAQRLLPNGRVSPCKRWWETNSLADNPRKDSGYSLKVELTGPRKGMWRDHATAEGGDMLELARMREFGGDKGKAVAWAKSELGLDGMDPDRVERVRFEIRERDRTAEEDAAREAEAKKRGARALWLSGVPIEGTAAARYLEGRGIRMEALGGRWPGSLLFHEEVWNVDARVKLPCMLATMVTPEGVQVATHRTWFGRDPRTRLWVKADGADIGVPRGSAKKVLGRCGGAFVPIAKGASGRSMGELASAAGDAEPVYVSEGIEDALSIAMIRPELRVIAAYSLGNIGAIAFPARIDPVVIVADRDAKPQAVEALERAIARQQARGKRVQLVMPPPGFKDMNEWLQAEQAKGEAA
ncbi:MAG: DUF7146 domain-containing protein [Sphingomonas oligoaromativorans]